MGPLQRIRLALLALGLVLVAGTLGYVIMLGFGVLDARYQTVTTVTTVGFRGRRPSGAGTARIHQRTTTSLNELAKTINPIVAGWINYYGLFGRIQMYPLLRRVNTYLMRWARNKYKRLRGYKRFHQWWTGLLDREPGLFTHWNLVRTFDWRG